MNTGWADHKTSKSNTQGQIGDVGCCVEVIAMQIWSNLVTDEKYKKSGFENLEWTKNCLLSYDCQWVIFMKRSKLTKKRAEHVFNQLSSEAWPDRKALVFRENEIGKDVSISSGRFLLLSVSISKSILIFCTSIADILMPCLMIFFLLSAVSALFTSEYGLCVFSMQIGWSHCKFSGCARIFRPCCKSRCYFRWDKDTLPDTTRRQCKKD